MLVVAPSCDRWRICRSLPAAINTCTIADQPIGEGSIKVPRTNRCEAAEVARFCLIFHLRSPLILIALLGLVHSGITAQTSAPQFVASTKGHVYYSVRCDAWKRLSAGNLRYF